MRVLMITSEWPSPQIPHAAPFVVRQVEFLRKAGIEVDVFHFRGAKSPLNYFGAWRTVQDRLSRIRYDLIHAQWGQSALLAFPKKLPLVITFRGSDAKGIIGQNGSYSIQGEILRRVSRWVVHKANEVIVVSDELMVDLGVSKCHIIPSGLNLELFLPIDMAFSRKSLGLSQTKKYVLFAGDSNNPVKRLGLAKKTLEFLRKIEPKAELLIASNIDHEKMPLYMNASNAMLLVSMHEGSPNVVKEALACNIPIVSVDVGDVRQRIGKIDGCIVCTNDKPEIIAMALKKVLTTDERIKGRETVSYLDENLLTKNVIAVYKSALVR